VSLRGATGHFPLETVLLLLSETGKTGLLEVRGDEGNGILGMSGGRLVSAEFEDEHGKPALGGIFTILRGDFEFVPNESVGSEDLSGELDDLLDGALVERDRIAKVREVIPHDRIRFRLSERAVGRDQIVLSSEQWRALLAADGERDVSGVAERLGTSRLATEDMLASLVRAGLIDTVEPPPGTGDRGHYRRLPPLQPIPPTAKGEAVVLRGTVADFPLETVVQLLAATKKTGRLEVRSDDGPSTLGVAEGRLVAATSGEEEGELALGSAFTAQQGEFDFVPAPDAPVANLTGEIDDLLDRAVEIRDRLVAVRTLIPSVRSRFSLSDRATRNPAISLTPEQWRALLAIQPQRDVAQIAEELHMRKLPTFMLLAELIRGGFVDVVPAEAERSWPYVDRRRAPWAPPSEAAPITEVPPPPSSVMEVAAEPEVAEAAPETETPLAETPIDRPAETSAEDRLSALTGVFGPAEPAPPPVSWEPPPPAEAPAADEWAAPTWETPAEAAPAEEAPAEIEIDPRLAAFAAPPAESAPAEAEVDPRLAAFDAWQTPAVQEPAVESPPAMAIPTVPEAVVEAPVEIPTKMSPAAEAAIASAPAAPAKKKGLLGMFGAKAEAAPAAATAAPAVSGSRSARLAAFANELLAGYNSGQYGKGHVEDRMLSLLMRVDEQADPIDRPLPIVNDRIDVAQIERGTVPETQAVPYLALLVRQIYEDAERALGKDKARKGFRDMRGRVFGKDLALFQSPDLASRLPKV
jgi:DNA-binding MarR family transcriptional regulator